MLNFSSDWHELQDNCSFLLDATLEEGMIQKKPIVMFISSHSQLTTILCFQRGDILTPAQGWMQP